MSPYAARALDLRRRTDAALVRVDRRINKDEGDGGVLGMITAPFRIGGEVLANAATEAQQIIPGIARLGYEVGKNTVQAVTGPIPGVPWSGAQAVGRLGTLGANVVNALGEDIRYVGQPIARGDVGELARRFKEQPIRAASTAMIAVPAAGAAVSGGLKAGSAVARSAGAIRTAERLAAGASKKTGPGSRRYRAPEVIEQPKVDRYGREVKVDGGPIERPRRPRSANPITREIQRAVNDRVVDAVRKAAGTRVITFRGKNINPMSPAMRYNRIINKDARNFGTQLIADMETNVLQGSQTFQSVVRKLPKTLGSKKNAKIAGHTAAIRAMGLNNLGKTHTSRTWGRDRLVKMYETARDTTDNPLHARDAQANIDVLRAIPDHWLDPAKAPKPVNDLTRVSIDMLNETTGLKVGTNLLSVEAAAASGRRAQAVVAGVGEEYRNLRKAVRAQEKAAAEITTLRGVIAGRQAQLAKMRTKVAAGGALSPKQQALSVALKEDIVAANQSIRSLTNKQAKKAAEATRLHAEVGAVVDWEMAPGSYFPNTRRPEPGIRNRKRIGPPVGKQTPRMTPRREFENKGIILRDGTAAFGPEVTLAAFRNAIDTVGRQRAVESLLTKYVVKDSNGVPITGAAARRLAEDSNDLYVSRSKMQLVRTLSGKDPKSPEAKALYKAAKGTEDTKYLIPKSVETGWRQALAPKRGWLDELNAFWKAGVLALTPRWYIQNMVGMWGQFSLGAGLDLQAIRMAKSPKYRDAVVSEIEGHGLASDLGEFVRRESGREGRNPLRRVVDFGYRWNAKFEAVPRRAMYFHAIKKKMRDEEMVKRGASSAELSEAWLNVIGAAKRGEKWADDLIGQATLETERFMGNYVRYNEFERAVLRRAFPFYGWMRAIHRLAFALPVKYPKRAALLFAASRMAYELYNDNESTLLDPIQGLVVGSGSFLGTSANNPADALRAGSELTSAIGRSLQRGDIGQIPTEILASAWEQANPLLTTPATVAMNVTPTGIPLNFGAGGDVFTDRQSGRSFTIDPTTGNIVDAENRLGIEQLLGKPFPIYNLAKRTLAGGTPTDSASLAALAAWRLRGAPASEAPSLVQPERPGGRALSRDLRYDLTNLLGFPVYRYSPKNALIESIRDIEAKKRAYENYIKQQAEGEAFYRKLGVR